MKYRSIRKRFISLLLKSYPKTIFDSESPMASFVQCAWSTVCYTLRSVLISTAVFYTHFAFAELDEELSPLVKQQRWKEAQQVVDNAIKKGTNKSESGHLWAIKGLLAWNENDHAKAEQFFEKVSLRSSRLEEYVRLFQGRLAMEHNQPKAAVAYYRAGLGLAAAMPLQFTFRYELADALIANKEYRAANKELEYLARRFRGDARYPEVLWKLLGLGRKASTSGKMCRYARQLYGVYPMHPVVATWGPSMWENKYDKLKLNCEVSFQDIKDRMRRLQMAGQGERARSEIELLRKRSASVTYELDDLLAQHLLREGFATEALTLMLKYAEVRRADPNFLANFATIAARAGEDNLSVAGYNQLAEISGKSRRASQALFQSAFLSYRFQDYDAADMRLDGLMSRLPAKSAKRLEALWYSAWVRYLKGDWAGAAGRFEVILDKYRLPRDPDRDLSWQKFTYWYARSLANLGRADDAIRFFTSLSEDPLRGYYSIAAEAWLSKSGAPSGPSQRERSVASMRLTNGVENPAKQKISEEPNGDASGEASEPSVGAEGTEAAPTDVVEPIAAEVAGEEATIVPTEFSDPRLAARLVRARELIGLGFPEMALWELADIERRTRNRDYLQTLMSYYLRVDGYHQSARLGTMTFLPQRSKGYGVSRMFWEIAYPKAYAEDVLVAAQRTGLEANIVWSIMRAESFYRPTVHSPAGAMGLMQMMPFTGEKVAGLNSIKNFQAQQLLQPNVNILLGAAYLNRLFGKFQSQLHLTAAAYNAGPHRVEDWLYSFGDLNADEFIEHIPFVETRNYVKKVLRNYVIYSELYGQRINIARMLTERIPVRIAAKPIGRENWD